MPAGRPKITLEDLPKDWKGLIDKHMSEGYSLEAIDAVLNISKMTRQRLRKEHEEFADAIKKGIRQSRLWWEENARSSLRDKEFNHILWYMNMRNRFGWRDKQEIDHTTKGDKIENINVNIVHGNTDQGNEGAGEEPSE